MASVLLVSGALGPIVKSDLLVMLWGRLWESAVTSRLHPNVLKWLYRLIYATEWSPQTTNTS